MQLGPDGSVAIVADCNTGKGTYEIEGNDITFQLGYTKMMCPSGSLFNQFAKYLEYADSFTVENGSLVLSYGNGAGTMTFAPAGQ